MEQKTKGLRGLYDIEKDRQEEAKLPPRDLEPDKSALDAMIKKDRMREQKLIPNHDPPQYKDGSTEAPMDWKFDINRGVASLTLSSGALVELWPGAEKCPISDNKEIVTAIWRCHLLSDPKDHSSIVGRPAEDYSAKAAFFQLRQILAHEKRRLKFLEAFAGEIDAFQAFADKRKTVLADTVQPDKTKEDESW